MAIGYAAGIFAALSLALGSLANWAERDGHSHPFDNGEEVVRFLLPSFMGQPGADRIMLLGASSVQEGLLGEEFERAFPEFDAYEASFGSATLDQMLMGLDYIERAYGEIALPEVLVVGVEPRAVANLPRTFGPLWDPEEEEADLLVAMDLYSSCCEPDQSGADGSRLRAKTPASSWSARWRFFTMKQRPRYQAGIAAALNRVVNGSGPGLEHMPRFPNIYSARRPLAPESARLFVTQGLVDPIGVLRGWLAAYLAPYHHYRPFERFPLNPDVQLNRIHHWDPRPEADLVLSQLHRLRDTAARHEIRMFFVVMPEHPGSRQSQPLEHYDYLMDLLSEGLGDTPLLNLWTFGEESDFFDEIHLTRPGAEEVTAEVIDFINAQGGLGR